MGKSLYVNSSKEEISLLEKNAKNAKIKQDKNDVVSFEDAISIIGTGYFQYKLVVIGGLILFASYIANGGTTFMLVASQCDLKMDSEMKGRLASASVFGLILSCHIMGFLSDTLGRRYILFRCLFCDGCLYFITSLLPNYTSFIILRVLNGFASCGSVVSIFAYIGEFQTNEFRSRGLLVSFLVASTAYICLPTFAWFMIPLKFSFEIYPGVTFRSWRLYYALLGTPSIICCLLIYCLPESPKFLLAKGRKIKALEVLKRMYIENKGDCDKFTIRDVKVTKGEEVAQLGTDKNKVFAFLELMWNQTVPLFKRPHRRNLFLVSMALFLTYYSNNSLYIWLPEAVNRIGIIRNETGMENGSFCEVINYKRQHNLKTTSLNNTIDSEILTFDNFNSTSLLRNSKELIQNLHTTTLNHPCSDFVDVSVFKTYILLGCVQVATWVIMVFLVKVINKKYLMLAFTFISCLSITSLFVPNDMRLIAIKASTSIVASCAVFPMLNGVVVDLFPTNLSFRNLKDPTQATHFHTLQKKIIFIIHSCKPTPSLMITVADVTLNKQRKKDSIYNRDLVTADFGIFIIWSTIVSLGAMAGCLTLMLYRTGTICGYVVAGVLIDSHCVWLVSSFVVTTTICFITIIVLPMKANVTDEIKDPTTNEEA